MIPPEARCVRVTATEGMWAPPTTERIPSILLGIHVSANPRNARFTSAYDDECKHEARS